MSHFLSSILSRHENAVEKVQPRLPGSFEPVSSFADTGNSASPGPHDMDISSPSSMEVPVSGTLPKPQTAKEFPLFSEKRAQFPEKNREQPMQPNPAGFQLPVALNTNPQPIDVPKNESSRLTPLPNQDSEPFKTGKNDEISPESGLFESRNQPLKSTEAIQEKGFQEIETIGYQPEGDRVERKQMDFLPVHPAEQSKKIYEPKGALGEPPGQLNSYGLNGAQARAPISTEPKAAPVIKVSIGQIHVRAINPAPPVSTPKPRPSHKPVLTLEDYLKGRG